MAAGEFDEAKRFFSKLEVDVVQDAILKEFPKLEVHS